MSIDSYEETVLLQGRIGDRLFSGVVSRAFFILLLLFSIPLGIITITNMFPNYSEIYLFAFLCTIYGMHGAAKIGKEERSRGAVRLNRWEIRVPRAFLDGLRGYRKRVNLCDIDHFLLSNQIKLIRGGFGNHTERICINVKIVMKQGRTYNLGDRKEEEVNEFVKTVSSILRIPIWDYQKEMIEGLDVTNTNYQSLKRTNPWLYIPEILIFLAVVMVFPINLIRIGEVANYELAIPSIIGLPCLFLFLHLRIRIGPRSVHFSADRFLVTYSIGRDREILFKDVATIYLRPSSAILDNWDSGLVEISGGLSAVQIGYVPALVLARRLSLV